MRSRLNRWAARWAAAAGTAVRIGGQILPGAAGLALVAYGAWLAWAPAGFMVGGALLLVDRAYARVAERRTESES